MPTELTERFLADRARGLIGWLIGLVLYCGLIVSFFPSIRGSESYDAVLDDYPEAFKEFFGGAADFELTTGPGFINAQLFAFMVPLLLAVVAIGFGAALGADQRSGLVDLLLANPIPRRHLVLARAWAMAFAVGGLAVAMTATVAVIGAVVDLGVGLWPLAAATVASVLLVMFHGLLALAVAAATGSRSTAVGVATVVFAAGYLLQALAGLVDWLEPFRVLSPYHHAAGSAPVINGWAPGNLAVLTSLCIVALGAAIALFDRRDLT